MGCWGMGMTQSDEFCEIYDKFMDSYNEGKAVADITAAILSEYHAEFDDTDGVMHDVYFALAKAEWMCCQQSELVLARVREIIESGANIEFYRELEATEKDLKVRQKNLEKFLDSLQIPRAKPRQRRIDPLDRVKELPPLEVGECYRYKFEDGYRVLAVLGFNKAQGWQDMVRCAIFQKTYSVTELKTVDFLNEPIHSIACYIGVEFLALSTIKKIANISVPEEKFTTTLSAIQVTLGHKKDFKATFTNSQQSTLAELFSDRSSFLWSSVKCGDIYAYQIDGKYRAFLLLHTRTMGFIPAIYCYAWRKTFVKLPTVEELKHEYVLPLGWFVEQSFPPESKLTYVGSDSTCEALKEINPATLYEKWKPATLSLAKEAHLIEDYPLSLCEVLYDVIHKASELAKTKEEFERNQGEPAMFGFKKKPTLDSVIDSLRKNEIKITAKKMRPNGAPNRSKFGGKPAVPAGFEWPRFEAENYEGETANRPLSFLCQINLEEISIYDKESLLPKTGMLLFFYEQDSSCWGFDPTDDGCARVYYFDDTKKLEPVDLPEDLKEEFQVKEYDLVFASQSSYPSFEELECHSDFDCDWDDYDEALEKRGYDLDDERHKLLGYADLIQGEMLTECERTARGLFCGDAKSYRNTPDEVKEDIRKSATEWTLLFQMNSIQEDDFELMFGDMGNLYFYIRKEDLKNKEFDKIWLVLQCG